MARVTRRLLAMAALAVFFAACAGSPGGVGRAGPGIVFTGWGPGTTTPSQQLSGSYSVAFTKNQCNYPIGIYVVEESGPLKVGYRTLVTMLADGQSLDLPPGIYDVSAPVPTALCDWVVTLAPR